MAETSESGRRVLLGRRVHFSVRLGQDDDRLCVLVMVGVRTDGTKELITIADGYRKSTES